MRFSDDGRTLYCQAAAPDWVLLVWAWDKSKLLCSLRVQLPAGGAVTHVTHHPGAAIHSHCKKRKQQQRVTQKMLALQYMYTYDFIFILSNLYLVACFWHMMWYKKPLHEKIRGKNKVKAA